MVGTKLNLVLPPNAVNSNATRGRCWTRVRSITYSLKLPICFISILCETSSVLDHRQKEKKNSSSSSFSLVYPYIFISHPLLLRLLRPEPLNRRNTQNKVLQILEMSVLVSSVVKSRARLVWGLLACIRTYVHTYHTYRRCMTVHTCVADTNGTYYPIFAPRKKAALWHERDGKKVGSSWEKCTYTRNGFKVAKAETHLGGLRAFVGHHFALISQ